MKIVLKENPGGKNIQLGEIGYGQVFRAKLDVGFEHSALYIIAADHTAVGSRLVLLEIETDTGILDRVVVDDPMELIFDYEPLESTLTIGE